MADQEKDTETRYLVAKILCAVAVLCCVAVLVICMAHPNDLKGGDQASNPTNAATTSPQIQYEKVDLQAMLDELDANALRAEETYQDKYIEIIGEIISFDSDGKYISIVPCGGSVWSEWVQCFTDPTQKAFLLEKNVGDVVTIRGEVVTIGEVLGYQIDIAEISD